MVRLNNLVPPQGARVKPFRVGRGIGSGNGKTAGRGHKGQKARSGGGVRRGFEGGQMPLVRRIPKRGFKNVNRKVMTVVNLDRLNGFADGTQVTPELLVESGIIKEIRDGVKILGQGDLKRSLVVRAHAFSESAAKKIEAAGGRAEVV
ncbi:MAG: 50S ribosomal protein L15 [Clostridia bacterium]|nr:50S ribosomal protein L15 [Clostridia bacterium]